MVATESTPDAVAVAGLGEAVAESTAVPAAPWLEEEVDLAWQAAQNELKAELKGEGGRIDEFRELFDRAASEARKHHAKRVLHPPPGPPMTDEDLRQRFITELNTAYRMSKFQALQKDFDREHLDPEDCRDARADALLGETQLKELREKGVVVLDWAMKPKEILAVRKEADARDAAGELTPFPTFSGYNVRGDRAKFIDGDAAGSLGDAVHLLRGLAFVLQDSGIFEPLRVPRRAMLACYPGKGAGYRAHKDSLDDDPRRVTCILYLQTLAWNSDRDGGELSVLLPGELRPKRIEPKGGRLVIFNSRTIEHEVLPARGQRMALTLWLWKAPDHCGEKPKEELTQVANQLPSTSDERAQAAVELAGDSA